jgi:hypothetical protein
MGGGAGGGCRNPGGCGFLPPLGFPPADISKEGLRMKLINNHGSIPMPPPYEGSMSNASVGEGAATPPHPPPYMFLMKLSWRSIQQMQEEETTNITYQIGRLHYCSNLEEDRSNHNTSKDTTRRTININHRKIKEEGRKENNNAFKFGLNFVLLLFFIFSFCATLHMCIIF